MYVTTTAIAEDDDTRSGGQRCDGELEKQSTGAVQMENTTAGQQLMDSNTSSTIVIESGRIEMVATHDRGLVHFSFCHCSIDHGIYYHEQTTK